MEDPLEQALPLFPVVSEPNGGCQHDQLPQKSKINFLQGLTLSLPPEPEPSQPTPQRPCWLGPAGSHSCPCLLHQGEGPSPASGWLGGWGRVGWGGGGGGGGWGWWGWLHCRPEHGPGKTLQAMHFFAANRQAAWGEPLGGLAGLAVAVRRQTCESALPRARVLPWPCPPAASCCSCCNAPSQELCTWQGSAAGPRGRSDAGLLLAMLLLELLREGRRGAAKGEVHGVHQRMRGCGGGMCYMRGVFCPQAGTPNARPRKAARVKHPAHGDSWGLPSARRSCCELPTVLDAPYGMPNALRALLPCSCVASVPIWANLPPG